MHEQMWCMKIPIIFFLLILQLTKRGGRGGDLIFVLWGSKQRRLGSNRCLLLKRIRGKLKWVCLWYKALGPIHANSVEWRWFQRCHVA
jgi:hypothetical protein